MIEVVDTDFDKERAPQERTVMSRHDRFRRGPALGVVSGLVLGLLSSPFSPSSPADAASSLTPFECKPLLYQFSRGELFPLDVASDPPGYSDKLTIEDSDVVSGANGVGWNTADNFIYGVSGKKVFRVGVGGAEVVKVDGVDLSYNGSSTAGDFIDDDVLLVGNQTGLNTINVSSGDINAYPLASGSTWSPSDMTYRNGYVYGMSADSLNVLRISETQSERVVETFTVTDQEGDALERASNGWGSAYATSGGDLFFYNNLSNNDNPSGDGSVWKISATEIQRITDEDSPTLRAEEILPGQNLPTSNDGFSCPNAQSFDADPVAAPDVYARTTTGSFSVSDPGQALTYGDQAGTGVRVESVTFRGITVRYDDPGNDQAIGDDSGPQLTIDNWDTGLFTISNISEASVSFTYTIKETATVSGQDAPRESEPATVTIQALAITDEANNELETSSTPEMIGTFRQFQDALSYRFYANGDTDETESDHDFFWRAEVVEDGGTLRSANNPPSRTLVSDIPGLSLNTRTGVLSGPVTGTTERTSDTTYDVRVWSSFDNQFKTSDSELFTFTINQPTLYDLSYDANFPDPEPESGTLPSTDEDEAITTVGSFTGLDESCYSFDSWSDGSGNSYDPNDSIILLADTTLTAQWTDERVGVTYNANGAEGGTVPTDSNRYCDQDDATVLGNPGNLTRAGFTLAGWSTSDSADTAEYEASDTVTMATSAVTLYATWSAIDYSVTYNANGATGGTVPTDSNAYNIGDTVTVLGNTGTLVRTGFTFRGWNTQVNGCGTTFAASATFTMPAANRTLYAMWQEPNCGSPGRDRDRDDDEAVVEIATPPAPPSGPAVRRLPVTPPAEEPSRTTAPRPQPVTPPDTPPAPPRTFDTGEGVVAGKALPSLRDVLSTATRSLTQAQRENLGGFAPSAGVRVEVRGSHSGARFVSTAALKANPDLLLEEIRLSAQFEASEFFRLEQLQRQDAPSLIPEPTAEEQRDIEELFQSVGLETPDVLSDQDIDKFSERGFIAVSGTLEGYKPGTPAFLVVNSEPIIIGSATIDEAGRADVSGSVPIDWFGEGEHRIRAVGTKFFEGIQVDGQGEIQLPDPVWQTIQEFDLGTQSTVTVSGPNAEGGEHTALRVIPLEPQAPWWTLWILLGAFILIAATRLRGILATRPQAVIGSFAVILAALPGVILGWISTVTAVALWAGGLGLLGAVIVVLLPNLTTQARRTPS